MKYERYRYWVYKVCLFILLNLALYIPFILSGDIITKLPTDGVEFDVTFKEVKPKWL